MQAAAVECGSNRKNAPGTCSRKLHLRTAKTSFVPKETTAADCKLWPVGCICRPHDLQAGPVGVGPGWGCTCQLRRKIAPAHCTCARRLTWKATIKCSPGGCCFRNPKGPIRLPIRLRTVALPFWFCVLAIFPQRILARAGGDIWGSCGNIPQCRGHSIIAHSWAHHQIRHGPTSN